MKSRAEQGLLPRRETHPAISATWVFPVRVFVFSHASYRPKALSAGRNTAPRCLYRARTSPERIASGRPGTTPATCCATRRGSKETSIGKGEYARVKSVDAPNNRLTVERKSGEEVSYDPRRQQGVSVYREQERAFSVGDRVQLTALYPDLKLANREQATVEGISQDGRIS